MYHCCTCQASHSSIFRMWAISSVTIIWTVNELWLWSQARNIIHQNWNNALTKVGRSNGCRIWKNPKKLQNNFIYSFYSYFLENLNWSTQAVGMQYWHPPETNNHDTLFPIDHSSISQPFLPDYLIHQQVEYFHEYTLQYTKLKMKTIKYKKVNIFSLYWHLTPASL